MISGTGFLSKIGHGLSALTGGILGSGPSTYQDPHMKEENEMAFQGVKQRNSLGNAPLTGASGINAATSGFNMQPLNTAISGFSTPNALESYKPAQFNFQSLPKQYEQMAYNISANPIRQEGQNQLTSLKNAIGNRRLGVLAKVGGENQQATNQRLAGLSNQLGLERMQEETDLGKQQQLSQADENLRTAQAAQQARQSRLQSLGTLGVQTPTLQSNLLENQRNYQDQGLDYLNQLLNRGTQQNQANVSNASNRRGQTLTAAANVAGAFA